MQQEVKAILTAEDRGYTSTLKNAQNVTETFGQKIKNGIGFGVLMRAGQKAFDVIGNSIASNLGGAVKRFDTINNFPKVMESLGFGADQAKNSMDTLGSSIDHLPTTLDKVASQTQQVVAVTGDLSKATDLTLALNNAMASGGAPAEQQASAINQWVQAMAKGKPDMQDWRALVQTAPAQMNQLSQALLGAGASQTDLYEAMQKGTVTMDEVNDAMIDLAKNGGDGFASWEEQAKSAGGGIQMALVNIKAGVQRNIANVLDTLNQKFEAFGGLGGILQSVVTPINAVGDALTGILNGTTTFSEAIGAMVESVGAKAQELIPKGMEMVSNLLAGIANQLPSIIKSGITLVLDLAMGIAKGLPQLLIRGLNAVTTFINGMSQGNGKLTKKAIDVVMKLASGIIRSLPQIISAGLRLMGALLQGLVRGFATIPSAVFALAKRIPDAVRRVAGEFVGIGGQMIAGLWNGIKSKFDSVIGKVRAMASNLPKAVKKVLGIASPSKVFAQIGEYTGEGFAIGIERSYRQVQSAMGGLYTMRPSMSGAMALSDDYSYNATARYEVIVPVQLNGKEIARATAGDMQTVLNQREQRANRKVGIR